MPSLSGCFHISQKIGQITRRIQNKICETKKRVSHISKMGGGGGKNKHNPKKTKTEGSGGGGDNKKIQKTEERTIYHSKV